MIFPCLTKTLAKYSVTSLGAREGALSYIKTIFWHAKLFFLYHRTRCSFRKSKNSLEFILTPSEILSSSTNSLHMIGAQNLTPPRRPSRVARHSSVNRTLENLILCYFLPIPFSRRRTSSFSHFPIFLRIRHPVDLGTSGTPSLSKTSLLV